MPDSYNGFTHTAESCTDTNQSETDKNNKNQNTTTTTPYSMVNSSNTKEVTRTPNVPVVVVVDNHNKDESSLLPSAQSSALTASSSLQSPAPLASDRKKYDLDELNWSGLNSEFQGYIYNNLNKARLNFGHAQRVINVIAHKQRSNSPIHSLPSFLAKLIQSAKDNALFDPISSVQVQQTSTLGIQGTDIVPPNLKSILRNHHITYDTLVRNGQNSEAKEYLIKNRLGWDGKRIYQTE